jgi:hypothetical protein
MTQFQGHFNIMAAENGIVSFSPLAPERAPYEHHISADAFEYIHDVRVVRTSEIRPRLAAMAGNSGLLGHRINRVLSRRAGQSPRLPGILGISAQDPPGGDYDRRLHRVRNVLPEGKTCLELCRGVCFPGRRRFLRVCVQIARACDLKFQAHSRWLPDRPAEIRRC